MEAADHCQALEDACPVFQADHDQVVDHDQEDQAGQVEEDLHPSGRAASIAVVQDEAWLEEKRDIRRHQPMDHCAAISDLCVARGLTFKPPPLHPFLSGKVG